MALIDFVKNLQAGDDWAGTSNAGLFNVETGNASFRTTCDQCLFQWGEGSFWF